MCTGAAGVRAAWGCRGSAGATGGGAGSYTRQAGRRSQGGRTRLTERTTKSMGGPSAGELPGQNNRALLRFSGERWPFLDDYWRKEESKQFSSEKWRRLLIASRELSSKCSKQLFSTKTACVSHQDITRVHGADELESMGSSKVLLENDIVSSHKKRRRESS